MKATGSNMCSESSAIYNGVGGKGWDKEWLQL